MQVRLSTEELERLPTPLLHPRFVAVTDVQVDDTTQRALHGRAVLEVRRTHWTPPIASRTSAARFASSGAGRCAAAFPGHRKSPASLVTSCAP